MSKTVTKTIRVQDRSYGRLEKVAGEFRLTLTAAVDVLLDSWSQQSPNEKMEVVRGSKGGRREKVSA